MQNNRVLEPEADCCSSLVSLDSYQINKRLVTSSAIAEPICSLAYCVLSTVTPVPMMRNALCQNKFEVLRTIRTLNPPTRP